MISRERFRELKKGDFILIGKNWRKIEKVFFPHNDQYCRTNSGGIYLRKIRGPNAMTVYLYSDIAHKVKGIIKKKI